MLYDVKWTGKVKSVDKWHILHERGELLHGGVFIPESSLTNFWANAYWDGSAETSAHLAALQRFYRALRDDKHLKWEKQPHHGIAIIDEDGKEKRLLSLKTMDSSLEELARACAGEALTESGVEIRTPGGRFGYLSKAGKRRFGILTWWDVATPLSELVESTAGWKPSAVNLEPALRRVFIPRISSISEPKPAEEEGEPVRQRGSAAGRHSEGVARDSTAISFYLEGNPGKQNTWELRDGDGYIIIQGDRCVTPKDTWSRAYWHAAPERTQKELFGELIRFYCALRNDGFHPAQDQISPEKLLIMSAGRATFFELPTGKWSPLEDAAAQPGIENVEFQTPYASFGFRSRNGQGQADDDNARWQVAVTAHQNVSALVERIFYATAPALRERTLLPYLEMVFSL